MPRAPRQRLDLLLVERACFDSREKARRAIMAGEVRVGDITADKPGLQVPADAVISVAEPPRYVGRGGLKLEAALAHFQPPVQEAVCLDVGASTGGFTDCLLQHGARRVYAVDVGHSQLDWKIRKDPRVVVHERLNARFLSRSDVPEPIDLCVADVSFISLTLILPPVFDLLTPAGMAIVLVKPQFELARADVGKGGIVRDPAAHARAVDKVERFAREILGAQWRGFIESPITGASGNHEFLACLSR